jgi:hypothetical protein
MDRMASSLTGSSNSPRPDDVESSARAALETADEIEKRTSPETDRRSGSTRRAVDRAAGSADAGEIQSQVMESASSAIRARPMATVASALVMGYLLGRL